MHLETIRCGSYEATINLSRGANCIRLYHSKFCAEILRQPDYSNLDNPYLYGMPILFPVNRISGGSFSFENRLYTFLVNEPTTGCALHGTLHEYLFDLVRKSDTQLVCRYCATDDHLYPGYPNAFEVVISYELSDEGLFQEVCIHNFSMMNMPVMLGLHTTFQLPFAKESNLKSISVYADIGEEFKRDSENYLPTGDILESDPDSDALLTGTYTPDHSISKHVRTAGRGKMTITDAQLGCTVTYDIDEKMPFRLIYGNGKSFLCFEPQTCMVNAPNAPFSLNDTGFLVLCPGEKIAYRFAISCEDL